MLSLLQSSPRRSQLLKVLVVVFLLAIAAFNVLPNYFTGRWSWATNPKVPHLSQLRQLKNQGLTISGWRTASQEIIDISGHEWVAQMITPDTPETQVRFQTSVLLLLRPQTWHRDLPQVDWMDINGVQRWTADSLRHLQFVATVPAHSEGEEGVRTEVPLRSATIDARFLRGWTTEQTFAVLQWYAWINGGSASPNAWFWADQFSQWRDRKRMPWVAVSILIPMKPLGDVSRLQPLAEELGSSVQSALMTHVFASKPPS